MPVCSSRSSSFFVSKGIVEATLAERLFIAAPFSFDNPAQCGGRTRGSRPLSRMMNS